MLGSVCYLGYYAIADAFVGAWFGRELVAEKAVVAVLVVNGFVQFMRTNTLTFRDASGAFYYDRWKPLAEGLCNVVLSVILVQYIGVVGVIAATVVTSLVICHVVEPYVLYKHAFQLSPKKYYAKNYGLMVLFGGELWLMDCFLQRSESLWIGLAANGGISLLISLSVCLCCVLLNKDLRRTVDGFLHKR
jgi:O-antigen/teichoic acid export membrane protein